MKTFNVILWMLIVLLALSSYGNKKLPILAKEEIKKIEIISIPQLENYSFIPIGINNNKIVFSYEDIPFKYHFFEHNESNNLFQEVNYSKYSNFEKSLSVKKYNEFWYRDHVIFNDSNSFMKVVYFDDCIELVLDSIHDADKKLYINHSFDGKYILVNTFSTLFDYYDEKIDDQIKIFDVDLLKKGIVKDSVLSCYHCSNPYLVNNFFFFEKAFKPDDGFGGFSNTHIYKSPFNNIDDTIRIASLSKIMAISPDGKYILGTRINDRPNYPCAIFDVENKKYQLLLGRDYSSMPAFYSKVKEKFAFCYNGYIIYIDFPTEYPFDALRENNPDIPDWTESEFYEQFVHPPLE